MRLSLTAFKDLLLRRGFEELPGPGEVTMFRHGRTNQFFTLSTPADATLGRALVARVLFDLDLIDPRVSLRQLKKGAGIERGSGHGTLEEQLGEVEKQIIQAALDQHGNVTRAAAALGLSRPTLYDKMRRYGCSNPWG